MKVYGTLDQAGLEQVSSSAATPAFPGRVIANVTTPTAAVPMFYNGSTWVPLVTGSTTGVVSQSAQYAATVDWSTGLVQQVILTGPCLISFSNPQAGQVHSLIITQGAASGVTTYYKATLNMADQDVRAGGGFYQPVGVPRANDSQVFSWFYSPGIKSSYSTIPAVAVQPQSAPAASTAIDISPDGKTLALASGTTPYQFYYNIYEGVAGRPMIGQKNLVTPTTANISNNGIAYSLDGATVFLGGVTSPYLQGFFLDRNHAAGTNLTAISGIVWQGGQIAMHPTGMFVAACGNATPFAAVVSFLGAGASASPAFTKLANPGTLPAATCSGVAWSPNGDYISVACISSPYIQTWAFSNYTGNGSATAGAWGAIAVAPATPPTVIPIGPLGAGKNVAWRPQGDFIALAGSSPYLYVTPFNRSAATYGTPLTITPATSSLTGTANFCLWSPSGQYLVVGMISSPWVNIYDFSAGSIGAPIAYDSSPFTAVAVDAVFSPGGDMLYVLTNTPNLIGISMPNKTKNYLRLNY